MFESRTEALYDEEQQRAILTAAGVAWRRQLKLVGILVRTAPADGRAAIRRREDEVDKLLPEPRLHRSSSTRGLRAAARASFAGWRVCSPPDGLRRGAVRGPGDGSRSRGRARRGTNHTDLINRALQAPRTALSRRVRESIKTMQQNELRVATPKRLAPPPPKRQREKGSRRVAKVKVDGSVDRRRRELGDRAERWALGCVIPMMVGCDVVMWERFSASRFWRTVAELEPVAVSAVPMILAAVLHTPMLGPAAPGFGMSAAAQRRCRGSCSRRSRTVTPTPPSTSRDSTPKPRTSRPPSDGRSTVMTVGARWPQSDGTGGREIAGGTDRRNRSRPRARWRLAALARSGPWRFSDHDGPTAYMSGPDGLPIEQIAQDPRGPLLPPRPARLR